MTSLFFFSYATNSCNIKYYKKEKDNIQHFMLRHPGCKDFTMPSGTFAIIDNSHSSFSVLVLDSNKWINELLAS